ncbi:hypothetical protein [Stappia indica]|uniref:Mu-like prophage FluMu N-terminal domain-containing protein n=1 Tax=Stappia indica TaxID=538381 RepID=A0A285TUF5_9HYPH|nr:hypothetical protein [Stappia indica]SOC27651.1 hypothetical protein SAMN05421512_12010 [Stappia indica]
MSRKTAARTSNKAPAPDKEAIATTEETATTPDAATVAAAQPEQEPAAAGEDKEADVPAKETAPEDEAAEETAEAGDVLVISAPRARRRAGLAFGPVPVRIPAETLTDEQLLAIESDRVLSVRIERV